MPQSLDNTVLMEGVRIIFRNFQGLEGQYNKAGERNFGVILDDKLARMLLEDGWNVKMLRPREQDEGDTETPWLPVAVRYDIFPPRIVLVTSKNRETLEEHQLDMLDWAEILNVDIIVRPHYWDVNGKSGLKAYVKTMYVTIQEDPLELKYAEMDAPH